METIKKDTTTWNFIFRTKVIIIILDNIFFCIRCMINKLIYIHIAIIFFVIDNFEAIKIL